MSLRDTYIWVALAAVITAPIFVATQSPLLQWRDPIYIIAGFSGIIGLVLILVQPLLISGILRGVPALRIHVWTGIGLVLAVVIHVVGLWITSPPDVVDVLLFRSPTPFSVWGAVAMWAVFSAALLAVVRRRIGLRVWRVGHSVAVAVVIIGTVVHAWQIQGAMGPVTKGALCLMVLGVGVWVLRARQAWRMLRYRQQR
jgi:predicted ferric reductase